MNFILDCVRRKISDVDEQYFTVLSFIELQKSINTCQKHKVMKKKINTKFSISTILFIQ